MDIKLQGSEVIDASHMNTEELFDLLRSNGLKIVQSTTEMKKAENGGEMPLTHEEVMRLKRNDIIEMYADLDLIYDFNKEIRLQNRNDSFRSHHGCTLHHLRPQYNLERNWDRMYPSRKMAYELACAGKDISIYSDYHAVDEYRIATIIKNAYDYVMLSDDILDKAEAQEMWDMYSSIFKEGDELNYVPHVKREIPENKKCAASKIFNPMPNEKVYLYIPREWVVKVPGGRGVFDSITFPKGFVDKVGSNVIDLSGYNFTYSEKDGESSIFGSYMRYCFEYSKFINVSKEIINEDGSYFLDENGKRKREWIVVGLKQLARCMKEYFKDDSSIKRTEFISSVSVKEDKSKETESNSVPMCEPKIYITVPKTWITEREGPKGSFDSIKLPKGLFVGEAENRIDLSGWSFTYSKTGGEIKEVDGCKTYEFVPGCKFTVSKAKRDSTGEWKSEYINLKLSTVKTAITQYLQDKAAEKKANTATSDITPFNNSTKSNYEHERIC